MGLFDRFKKKKSGDPEFVSEKTESAEQEAPAEADFEQPAEQPEEVEE